MVNGDLSRMVEEELQRRGGYPSLEAGLLSQNQQSSDSKKPASGLHSFEPSDGKGPLRNQCARTCCFLCTSSFMRWMVVLVGLTCGLYLYSNAVHNGWSPPHYGPAAATNLQANPTTPEGGETKSYQESAQDVINPEDSQTSDIVAEPADGSSAAKLVAEDEVVPSTKTASVASANTAPEEKAPAVSKHTPLENLPVLTSTDASDETEAKSLESEDTEVAPAASTRLADAKTHEDSKHSTTQEKIGSSVKITAKSGSIIKSTASEVIENSGESADSLEKVSEAEEAATGPKTKTDPAIPKTKAALVAPKAKAVPIAAKTKAAATVTKTKAAHAVAKTKAAPVAPKAKAVPIAAKTKAAATVASNKAEEDTTSVDDVADVGPEVEAETVVADSEQEDKVVHTLSPHEPNKKIPRGLIDGRRPDGVTLGR